jgi:tRNA (cytidine/uridine-2'-O-)-methyltransferase
MFNVLLNEPEIPGNTGNVIRLCANTGARLHLIGPLGFTLEAAQLRRAGLDYHDLASVQRHADLRSCVLALKPRRVVVVETGAALRLSDVAIEPDECLLFGSETRGLPADFASGLEVPLVAVSLPMRPSNRSLNLSNAVAVTVFEAWRQNGFAGADSAPFIRTPP